MGSGFRGSSCLVRTVSGIGIMSLELGGMYWICTQIMPRG